MMKWADLFLENSKGVKVYTMQITTTSETVLER